MIRRVVVLGGTGFVGRALALRCASNRPEWLLRVPTRRLAQGGALRMVPGVELVEADIHEAHALMSLLADADVVVNLVAILHGREAQFQRVHVDLPRRIGQACRAAGVAHLVHVSALGVGPGAPSMYLRSKTEGEAALQAAGVPLTLLRPSVVFGAEDRFLNLFARIQRLLPIMALPCASAQFQPVWVRDLAAALQRCIEDAATAGKTYEIAGPEVITLADLVRMAGRHAGHQRPVIALPLALGMAQAWLFEHLPGSPLMSRDNLRSMARPNVASGTLPGLADLGVRATPIDVAWAEDDAAGRLADELGRWRSQHRGL
jgi:NADH dehydrogenase